MPLTQLRRCVFTNTAAIGILLGAATAAHAGNAGPVTYNEHVAEILQRNCVTCHRPSGQDAGGLVAPMSLRTYREARPWARAIATRVSRREMPPWFADHPRGVFKNERGLTDEEVRTIVDWVGAGAPEGDPAKAPPPPAGATNTSGWTLGRPDIIVKLAEPYVVKDEDEDVQGSFHIALTPDILPRDIVVRAWEFRAGTHDAKSNNSVHHMCGGAHPPGYQGQAEAGEEGGKATASLGCTAGGAEPFELPEGFGRKVYANGVVTFGMHYYKEKGPGTTFKSQPEVGFYLAKGPIKHIVDTSSIGDRAFEIPPRHPNYPVGGAMTMKKDTLVFALWPHAHLRAKAARYTATYPDGRTEVLLNVPRYDQSWQVTYQYREPKLLPRGTRLDVVMYYDNSPERAVKRGFNPDIPVWYGPRTQDEMMLGFFTYAELDPETASRVKSSAQQQD